MNPCANAPRFSGSSLRRRWTGAIPAVVGAGLLIAVSSATAQARVAAAKPFDPGRILAQTNIRWIFPYVRVLDEAVSVPHDPGNSDSTAGFLRRTVRWYSESGDIRHEMPFEWHEGGLVGSEETVAGISPYWSMPRPHHSGDVDVYSSTPGGIGYASAHLDDRGRPIVELYLLGRHVRTFGPFPGALGWVTAQFNESGAFACASDDPARDEATDVTEVLVTGPDASELRAVSIPSRAQLHSPDPTGRGILCTLGYQWLWCDSPQAVKLDVESHAFPVAWAPDMVLFCEPTKHGPAYQLLELDSGARRWQIDGHGPPELNPRNGLAAIRKNWVVLLDFDLDADGDRGRGTPRVHVLDLESGMLLFTWSGALQNVDSFQAKLVSSNDRLYYLKDDRFSLLDFDEITRNDSHWSLRPERPPSEPKPPSTTVAR